MTGKSSSMAEAPCAMASAPCPTEHTNRGQAVYTTVATGCLGPVHIVILGYEQKIQVVDDASLTACSSGVTRAGHTVMDIETSCTDGVCPYCGSSKCRGNCGSTGGGFVWLLSYLDPSSLRTDRPVGQEVPTNQQRDRQLSYLQTHPHSTIKSSWRDPELWHVRRIMSLSQINILEDHQTYCIHDLSSRYLSLRTTSSQISPCSYSRAIVSAVNLLPSRLSITQCLVPTVSAPTSAPKSNNLLKICLQPFCAAICSSVHPRLSLTYKTSPTGSRSINASKVDSLLFHTAQVTGPHIWSVV